MQKFHFLLLTRWLESPVFLKEVAPDFLVLCLSVVVFKTWSFNTLYTYGILQKHCMSHPWPYTHDTSAAPETG